MIVVKLGGSLYNNPNLTDWLQCLSSSADKQTIIIVPGGGPFADVARQAQKVHNFDDDYAHQMAIMAMRQFGTLLLGLCPNAKPYLYRQQIPDSLSIWLPEPETIDNTLPHSWDITADSLSLWLSQQLNADQLYLIKHTETPSQDIKQLSAQGIIDKAFPALYESSPPLPLTLLNANEPTSCLIDG